MKKLGIWLVLFIVTLLGVVAGWNWHYLWTPPQALEASYYPTPFKAESLPSLSDAPAIAPTVNGNRLLADLSALAFQRFTESDRSRARSYIVQALQAAGWAPQIQTFASGMNIVAERPGTDPTLGAILLGAHYDTVEVSPGADDNATGVATVLEVARLLGDRPTPRSLKLALFDLEEIGLVGSFAFANETDQTETLAGAVILDMIGFACDTAGCQHYPPVLPITPPTDRGNFLAVIGDQGHLPLINAFPGASRDGLPQVLTLPVPLLGPFTPDLLRSDHAPFWQKGIGAVMITDTANFRNPNYHQAGDTVETIHQPFFVGSAQIVVNALTDLLHRQESMTTAPSVPQRLETPPDPTIPL